MTLKTMHGALHGMYGFGLTVRNVNEALPLGLQLVQSHGVPVTSRGLATLEVPGPVTTIYRAPEERVLFCPIRDANPFFHFFESLWILAGARTVHLPRTFLQRIEDYSDDGKEFHGAYGHRLMHAYGFDQLEKAGEILATRPDSRQVVCSIWHPTLDLGMATKDTPCNDMIMFKVRDGMLNMTVNNRSNDVIWGAYGANAVQFSIIQEYVAALAGTTVGYYTQVSDSYHVYVDNPLWQKFASGQYMPEGHVVNPYNMGDLSVTPRPMFHDRADALACRADAQLLNQMAEKGVIHHAPVAWMNKQFTSSLFNDVAIPMLLAFFNYKSGDMDGAWRMANDNIKARDWAAACGQWISRRDRARKAKEQA